MDNLTYEQAINELEKIIKQLELNNISLEESITLFERGVQLSQYCDQKLKNVSNKIAKIYENNELSDFEIKEL